MQDLSLYDLEGEEEELGTETDVPVAEVDEEEDFSDFAINNEE